MNASWANDYIIVSVAGFRTIRDRDCKKNVLCSWIDKKGEPSGVWSSAPTNENNKKILATTYLTHFSGNDELEAVLKLFEKEDGTCNQNIDMILIANSWGAVKSQKLARLFYKKCNLKPSMTFMIEGVLKPTNLSYRFDLLSENCINIFQKKSTLHGDRIENCKNYELDYSNSNDSLYKSHIAAEWDGGQLMRRSILNYLSFDEFEVNGDFGISFK